MFPARGRTNYAFLPVTYHCGETREVGLGEFLDMGGYGAYVWPAYGLSGLAIAGLAVAIWRRGRILRRRLKEAEKARTAASRTDAAS